MGRLYSARQTEPGGRLYATQRGEDRKGGKAMFETLLYEATMIVAQVHESLMHLNDSFELALDDKQLHFFVMFAIGMVIFFMVHFVFKRLAKWSITAVSFIYVFTVMAVLGFAIEVGQRITGTGSMDFADVVAGLYGVIVFFLIYSAYRLAVFWGAWVLRRVRAKRTGGRDDAPQA